MKKVLMSLVMVVGLVSASKAVEPTKWHVMVDSQTVNATAVVTSDALYVGDYESFSFLVIVHSGATPEVDLTYEIISSNADIYTNVESTSSMKGIQPIWIKPSTDGTIGSAIDINTADAFAPAATKFIRLKVTGTASNGADTVVSVLLCGYASR